MFLEVLGVVLMQKTGLISGILRGECFILWNWFVKSNIVGQKQDGVMVVGLHISEVDVRVSYIFRLGSYMYNSRRSYNQIPPSFLILVCVLCQTSPVHAL